MVTYFNQKNMLLNNDPKNLKCYNKLLQTQNITILTQSNMNYHTRVYKSMTGSGC